MKGIGRLLLTAWLGIAVASASPATAQDAGMQKWTKGKGWGWVWGPQDEVGAFADLDEPLNLRRSEPRRTRRGHLTRLRPRGLSRGRFRLGAAFNVRFGHVASSEGDVGAAKDYRKTS